MDAVFFFAVLLAALRVEPVDFLAAMRVSSICVIAVIITALKSSIEAFRIPKRFRSTTVACMRLSLNLGLFAALAARSDTTDRFAPHKSLRLELITDDATASFFLSINDLPLRFLSFLSRKLFIC